MESYAVSWGKKGNWKCRWTRQCKCITSKDEFLFQDQKRTDVNILVFLAGNYSIGKFRCQMYIIKYYLIYYKVLHNLDDKCIL